jgi:hypothetical protein
MTRSKMTLQCTVPHIRFDFKSGNYGNLPTANPRFRNSPQSLPEGWHCCRNVGNLAKFSGTALRILRKSHGYNIPTTIFGFVEALVRDFEQLDGG